MKVPTSHPDHQKWMFPCHADDSHWVLVEWWDTDDDHPILEVVLVLWPQTWRSRIVSAINSLRGRQVPVDYVLLDPQRARELGRLIHYLPGVFDNTTPGTDLNAWQRIVDLETQRAELIAHLADMQRQLSAAGVDRASPDGGGSS